MIWYEEKKPVHSEVGNVQVFFTQGGKCVSVCVCIYLRSGQTKVNERTKNFCARMNLAET